MPAKSKSKTELKTSNDNKKSTSLTVSEFKTWLEGAEAFQGDDWAPDVSQWRIIRQKIHNLVEAQPKEPNMVAPPQAPLAPQTSALVPPATQHPQTAQRPSQPQKPVQIESSGFARTSEGGYESPFK